MDFIFTPKVILSFLTLSFLEIVLGIDNLIFVALTVTNLPKRYRRSARLIGLSLALVIRIVMLFGAKWVMSLVEPAFTFIIPLSYKDILLILGGLFLVIKGSHEIKADLGERKKAKPVKAASGFASAILQITLVDFVFSFDSIITAIGMTTNIPIIVAAVTVSMIVMLVASSSLADLLEKYPAFKILGLAFIILIGAIIFAEGIHFHIDRGFIYAALGFSIFVEVLNTLYRKKHPQ